MNFENQVAIVTGGASGMGRASAEALLHRGLRVMVWDRIACDVPGVHSLVCDVSSASEVEAALQQTIEEIGVPSVCLNCAGIAPARRMVNKEGAMPLDAFKQVIEVNLIGTFNVMRVVADAMIKLTPNQEGERGVIINTASIAAYEGQIGQLAYSASKGGVVAMTLPAARELAAHGIRVNTIAPGLMATPMLLSMPDEVQDALTSGLLFPKRLGKPEEYAALVIHILENTMLNGEVIRLDGALRLQPR